MSGGGDNGAFGAGLLNGWTETGTRPEFKMVTGVSTGALIAPFAFLGPQLRSRACARSTRRSLPTGFSVRAGICAALFDDAMADTSPLADVIAKYADEKMFAAIAREYNEGRLLLIGTTDLDAQRPVIWNIGALAASGKPEALKLFRQDPARLGGDPRRLRAGDDRRRARRQEISRRCMSTAAPSPSFSSIRRPSRPAVCSSANAHAYIIRNARLDPDYAMAERRTISIVGRAISTMLAASGHNDVLRTYFVSQRDGVDYNLAYIGADFTLEKKGEFEQAYMQALFEYGYEQAKSGREWHKLPPAFAQQTIQY